MSMGKKSLADFASMSFR